MTKIHLRAKYNESQKQVKELTEEKIQIAEESFVAGAKHGGDMITHRRFQAAKEWVTYRFTLTPKQEEKA